VCGPCSRSASYFRDCEWNDGEVTQTQLLQNQIAALEARLEELQHPGDGTLSLYHPYAGASRSPAPISERSIHPALG
jgi:hypothetical protein